MAARKVSSTKEKITKAPAKKSANPTTKKTSSKKKVPEKETKEITPAEEPADENKSLKKNSDPTRRKKRKTSRKKSAPKGASKKTKVAPVQPGGDIPTLGAYLTKDELCQLIGLSSRRVEQLVRDGTITQTKEGRAVRFETVAVIKQYIEHLSDKANGRKDKETANELSIQKLKAEIALKESQGELHRLRTDIASGKYIPTEEIKIEYSRMMIQLRNYILGIPNRITGRLTGRLKPLEVREVEKELQDITTTMLRGFVQSAVVEDQEEIPTPKGRTLNEKKSAKIKV